MAVNKVVYGGKTLIDLTGDTVTADALWNGYKAHKADGSVITGTFMKNWPSEVTINMTTGTGSAENINKVAYYGNALIDLTSDTVLSNKMVSGYTSHDSSGKKIVGNCFSGYPTSNLFSDSITDSSGNAITDSSSSVIQSNIVYKKYSQNNTTGKVVYQKA